MSLSSASIAAPSASRTQAVKPVHTESMNASSHSSQGVAQSTDLSAFEQSLERLTARTQSVEEPAVPDADANEELVTSSHNNRTGDERANTLDAGWQPGGLTVRHTVEPGGLDLGATAASWAHGTDTAMVPLASPTAHADTKLLPRAANPVGHANLSAFVSEHRRRQLDEVVTRWQFVILDTPGASVQVDMQRLANGRWQAIIDGADKHAAASAEALQRRLPDIDVLVPAQDPR